MKALKAFIVAMLLFALASAGYVGFSYYVAVKDYEEMLKASELEAIESVEKLSKQIVTIKLGAKSVIKKYGDIVAVDYELKQDEFKFEFPKRTEPHYELRILKSVRTSVLYDMIESMYEEPVKSDVVFSYENGWEIVYGDYTYAVNIDDAYQYLDSALYESSGTYEINRFVEQPSIEGTPIENKYEAVKWMNDFTMSYGGIEYLNGKDLYPYVHDYKLDIDNVDLSDIKTKLQIAYNTIGNSYKGVGSNGTYVDVPYMTYGIYVNWEGEKADIISALELHESLIKDRPKMYGYDDIASEYIEVSLDDQHVWHYVKGELCCETDCVTGTKDRRDTPTGVYYVTERINGKYLTGADYKTWVYKWMRLTNSGIGLHDAYWRKKFGGNIYTYDGSHGCINLPSTYAYNLFDEIRNGIAVIIY